jgi:bifunctional N-acetylglucosamine-1-phosphate-uridyltransferase/glucosamine-1-phosphate-acetyltransferase GlmU-like protein
MLMRALTLCSLVSLATMTPVQVEAGALPQSAAHVERAQFASTVLGPYATIRRANEVANYARSLGYSAFVYPNGDGYYVRIW